MDIRAKILLDSKDLFTLLSARRNSIDRSIRIDVTFIWYKLEVGCVDLISRIQVKLNLADVKKTFVPFNDFLLLTLFNGHMKVYKPKIVTRCAKSNMVRRGRERKIHCWIQKGYVF